MPALIDFWAAWCGPCRMVSPVLDKLATEQAGRIKLVKVDVDKSPALSQRFDIQAIPTLMVIRAAKWWPGRRAPRRRRRCANGSTAPWRRARRVLHAGLKWRKQ